MALQGAMECLRMLSGFLKDRRGNYALITAITTVPLMGALALGIDYSEMSRQRQSALNALDAAGIATARRAVEGATDAQLIDYAQEFFKANLGSVDPAKTTLSVVLPSNNAGGGTLKLSVDVDYNPYFLGAFRTLLNGGGNQQLSFYAESEIRLKNTLEVALVLDNSLSMDTNGSGTGKKRIVLLKEAAKQLVDTIAKQAEQMKQVDKPVQFALVPFSASVNVGSQHAGARWMDVDGRSPIHHENFDWSTMPNNSKVTKSANGVHYKEGAGWGAQNGDKVTRFTLYDTLRRVTSMKPEKVGSEYRCIETNRRGQCTKNGWVDIFEDVPATWASVTSWSGCVETRPHPYAYSDDTPVSGTPATLFVPMFAPDESDRINNQKPNWWPDVLGGTDNRKRQEYMPKYFQDAPLGSGTNASGDGKGPNIGCQTTPITPLTDVSKAAGLKTIKDAIDAMKPVDTTDVPEGTAWGWRVLSSGEPFTEGRPEHEKGNDKVLIVLTDGANTYFTPGYSDGAGNKSLYSNKGYTGKNYDNGDTTRMFMGTENLNKNLHTRDNYTSAMNQHMDTVCDNAKSAGVIVMTVALDLSDKKSDEKAAIEAMKRCASDSRFRRDSEDSTKAAKLFWNANGSNLAEKFKEIADELSNLRIVG